MPRRSRRHTGQFVFHVLNRCIETLALFESAQDYAVFLPILTKAAERFPVRVLAYALMPNHWHLVLWPSEDSALCTFMQWLTVTHAKRWREMKGSTGRGAVYQGRYKAIPIQRDAHFLRTCLYVERNALRAHLVRRAEDWAWCSASPAAAGQGPPLAPWPVAKPTDWVEQLNVPELPKELEEIRKAIRKGWPFGNITWRAGTMKRLDWSVAGPRGRPRGSGNGPCRDRMRALARQGRVTPCDFGLYVPGDQPDQRGRERATVVGTAEQTDDSVSARPACHERTPDT